MMKPQQPRPSPASGPPSSVVGDGPGFGRQLTWLLGLRAASAGVLFGTAILARRGAGEGLASDPFFTVIAVTFGLTALYAAALRTTERHPWLVELQLASDVLVISAIVWLTGGIQSDFPSLYVLPVLAAAVIRSRAGGLRIAAFGGVCYGTLVAAQYGALSFVDMGAVSGLPPSRLALHTVGLSVFGQLAVAVLAGYAVERERRADRRLAEASTEIAGLQALTEHVVDSLAGGVLATDREGRVLSFNRAAEQITGWKAGRAHGTPVAEVLRLPATFTAGIERLTPEDGPLSLEHDYDRADGTRIRVGLNASPLVAADSPVGYVFSFQDLTERRRRERDAELRERLAAIGEMAAGIAHEIRNPLASMSGAIQILHRELTGELSVEQAQLMDIVLRESERLDDTIREFLAFARPQPRQVDRVDVGAVLSETASLLRHGRECLDAHDIVVEAPPGVLCDADESQLRQIVWNLSTNALRATTGGGRLRLAARGATEAGAARVVIDVEDDGVGIPEDQITRVFEPFWSTFKKGSGLGLAIVHRLVTDCHGTVRIASEPGRGTTVTVSLPRDAAASASGSGQGAGAAAPVWPPRAASA